MSSQRSFSAENLVHLPRLDVRGAIALGAGLLATVAPVEEMLPPAVDQARRRLVERHQVLEKLAEPRSPEGLTIDPERVKNVDHAVDTAWTGLMLWLGGWAKLPDRYPQRAVANRIGSALFPDGLAFIQLPFKLEWAESENKLQRIESDRLDREIEALGGGAFLEALRAAHREYGEVLGMTGPASPAGQGAQVREALESFAKALRAYVVQVAAFGEAASDEAVQGVARQLLAPLAQFDRSGSDDDADPLAATGKHTGQAN